MSASLRASAAEVTGELAERLRDPDSVISATEANGPHAGIQGTPPWAPTSLSYGYPALALLYTEFGYTDPRHRGTAHEYLQRSAACTRDVPVQGPFGGLGALASVVRAASGHGDYAAILARLDTHMIAYANRLVAQQSSLRDSGQPTYPAAVDVVSGLTGMGRYLLHRRRSDERPGEQDGEGDCESALRATLGCLASLRQSLVIKGVEVPGWWYRAEPHATAAGEFANGRVDLGIAHGIPGPLTLLSLAWRDGVRVPGQAEAIEVMAEWLLRWQEEDDAGPYWVPRMSLPYYTDPGSHPVPEPARASWCYGALGTARALDLAGQALGRPSWTEAGVENVRAMVRRPTDHWGVVNDALCHGWASVLYPLSLLDAEHPQAGLAEAADDVAERLLRHFEPAAPFGYRYFRPSAGRYFDLPGFLDGAAGIALALHAYATRRAPASGWDTILLLN